MKQKKEKKMKMNIDAYLIIISVMVILLTLISFLDFGNRLHYFPLILILGGSLNGFLSLSDLKEKKKVSGIIYGLVAVILLVAGVVVCFQVWG